MTYTPQMAAGTEMGTTTQQPATSIDLDVMEFMHNIPPDVPLEVRELAWGFVNPILGLTFLSPAEVRAQIHRVYEHAISLKRAVPARKVTDTFINWLNNFIELCKLKIYQSALRAKGFTNERYILSAQLQEVITSNGGAAAGGRRRQIIPIPGSPV